MRSVKTSEAGIGPNPQKAIPRLQHDIHLARGKSVLLGKAGTQVAIDGLCRVQRQRLNTKDAEKEHARPQVRGHQICIRPRRTAMVTACVRSFARSLSTMFLI